MMDIKGALHHWFIFFLEKKTARGAVNNKIMPNRKLTEQLHKPIIKKLKNKKYTHLKEATFEVLILPICN